MRIAFMGTPDFAATSLDALVKAGHEIAVVYSQPPAPRGRGQALQPSAVQALAERLGIAVRTPVSMRDPAEIEAFAALDLDAAVVVAFGQILPAAILEAPRLGAYNLHASLLPRWRGAAPIQRAIMAGDAMTGAQVMRMTEGLDEGPVIASAALRIDAASARSRWITVWRSRRMLPIGLPMIRMSSMKNTAKLMNAKPNGGDMCRCSGCCVGDLR